MRGERGGRMRMGKTKRTRRTRRRVRMVGWRMLEDAEKERRKDRRRPAEYANAPLT
jgi:hypothetical protein